MVSSMGSNTLGQASAISFLRRYALYALLALVIVYALLAGLRTITDADTGWQLASGRYIVQHRQIPAFKVGDQWRILESRFQEWMRVEEQSAPRLG